MNDWAEEIAGEEGADVDVVMKRADDALFQKIGIRISGARPPQRSKTEPHTNPEPSPEGKKMTTASNVFKALDDQVAEAEDRLAKASSDFARTQLQGELETARRRRYVAKLIAKGTTPSRFGPGTTELFKSGLSTLPDEDHNLSYR